MKTATTWLCPALTLLCAVNLVYTAQRGSYDSYPLDSLDSQILQNDYFLSKRNKPSLSIVNPLDVLRQRLLLEIARRQMKENSRQVELNRAILKNVGKRMASKKYASPLAAAFYDLQAVQQQQQQQLEPNEHFQPYEYELLPTTLIFDYRQQQEQKQQQQQQKRRHWLSYDSNAIPFVNNYINEKTDEAALAFSNTHDNDDEFGEEYAEPDIIAFNGIVGNTNKHSFKHAKQMNNEHSANKANEQHEETVFQKSLINNHQLHHNKNDLNLNPNDESPVSAKTLANDYKNEQINDNDGDYQLQRYLYHLHKNQNHLARK